MVLSTAKPTGEFDHAVLAPNDEVYTPGSIVQFSATGVDAAGGSAAIPAGASWSVISGGGNIDKNGLYTAPNTIGEVTVSLMVGGQSVGKTSIQLQWPDKLGFTSIRTEPLSGRWTRTNQLAISIIFKWRATFIHIG